MLKMLKIETIVGILTFISMRKEFEEETFEISFLIEWSMNKVL